jgi:heat shock protein HslJ
MPGGSIIMKICLLLLPLALAACMAVPESNTRAATSAATGTSAPASPGSLSRYHWQLHDAVDNNGKRLDALFGQPDKPLQLDFADGRISVRNACNGIGGSYLIVDGHLAVAQMLQTMMACPDPTLMQRETTIKAVLGGKPTLIFSAAGDVPLLTLAGEDGRTLTFAGQPTAATRHDGPGTTVFLEVAARSTPCNHPLIPDKSCLLARELHYDTHGLRIGQPGPWQPLQQDIEGYAHQPGIRNVLRVKRYTLAPPPVDAPATTYVLDAVIETETVKSADPDDAQGH